MQARSLGCAHAFSTRCGGVSGDLDFAGDPDDVAGDTARLAARVGCGTRSLFRVRQVHSARVVAVERGVAPGQVAQIEADALISAEVGIFVAVQTADCVPVLLCDVERRVVAAAHAGWRGLVGGVLEATVAEMQRRFGSQPASLRAAIGPSVCPDCYEVSPEVAGRFAHLEGAVASRPGRPHVDLRLAARRILMRVGLSAAAVTTVDLCTACRADLFFSYRRDGGQAGRQLSVIGFARRRASMINQ